MFDANSTEKKKEKVCPFFCKTKPIRLFLTRSEAGMRYDKSRTTRKERSD